MRRWFFIGLAPCLFFSGCADSLPRASEKKSELTWAENGYSVRFTAGPRLNSQRTLSYYTINRRESQESAAIVSSAHSTEITEDFKRFIRVIPSSGRESILIEEEIPNDCCACSNFILVTTG